MSFDSPIPTSPAPDPTMPVYPQSNGATPSSSSASLLASPPATAHSADSPVPQIDASISHSPSPAVPDAPAPSLADTDASASTNPNPSPAQEVDGQILEALRSKDRIYVLKLGELMEGLINEHRPRIEVQPTTTYQRMLVHRCAAYYKLAPESDPVSKVINVLPTAETRIPALRICELVPAEPTSQPAFKIMRRSPSDRRSKPHSQAGSVAGEDADLSDIEPSEAGSLGGRSNATGGSNKKRMTIEEREAAYNEARMRIFQGFVEKDKEKEKDTSASSSSLSVVSSSASTNGGGSIGDLDDSGSSPATESEWSGPVTRDKTRRGGGSAASSARSLRSGAPTFNANGSTSSRNSRAPSPSFNYPSLYEPPPSAPALYDPSQHATHANPTYHPTQYIYPYPPGQPSNPPFMAPYPYYPYNPYPSPSAHPQAVSDPTTPSGGDLYVSPQATYSNQYAWSPQHAGQSPLQSPPQMPHHPLSPQHHHQNPNNVLPPASQAAQQQQQYQPQHYMPPPPPHAYTYPMPMGGYYAPPPQGHMAPPPTHMGQQHHQQQGMYDAQRGMNGDGGAPLNGHVGGSHNNMGGQRPPLGNGVITANGNANGRGVVRGGGVGAIGNGKPRGGGAIPPQAKQAWSYGPGVGMGGYPALLPPNNGSGSEPVGPRLTSNRRASQNSRSSSNCDDVSSTSSTSSSSRTTYTSTTSSQHPLPPRPDWAVGLKPQPTLTGRHHDHSLASARTMSPISPPRTLNGSGSSHQRQAQQQAPPASLQAMDFPPLSSVAEKRIPVVAGAWGNTSTRTILQASAPGSALVSPSANNTRLEEPDRGFERPPPKSVQLFNPKVSPRLASNGSATGKPQGEKDKEQARDGVASAILLDEMESMSLENHGSSETAAPAEAQTGSASI